MLGKLAHLAAQGRFPVRAGGGGVMGQAAESRPQTFGSVKL